MAFASVSQEISFEQISTVQGLSQSNVTCMAYDHLGYLWIGTDDGLNRYDGYSFKTYEYDEKDANSLPSSAIRSIYSSKAGVLWIGTVGGGICRYDQDSDGFVSYKNIPEDTHSLSDNMILAIAEDDFGNLWVGTEKGGINRLSFEENKIEPYITSIQSSEAENSLNHNYVHSICSAENGDLIIGSWGGINILKKEDLKENFNDDFTMSGIVADGESGLTHNAVRTIEETRQEGEFWIGTWGGGLNKLLEKDGQYLIEKDFDSALKIATSEYRYISNIHENINGQVWIGSFERGLTLYEPDASSIVKYSNDSLSHNYISSNFVSAFESDSSGIVWVGTYGGGINKYDNVEQPFKLFQYSNNADYKISNNLIFAIHQDSLFNVWIGTHGGGLNKLKREGDDYKLSQVYRAGEVPSDIIISLGEDIQDRLWVGTREGLSIYNDKKNQFEFVASQPESEDGLWGKFIWEIYRDRSGAMWVGTRRGLNKWDPETLSFTHYYESSDHINSLSNNNVYCVFEDSRGFLWVGTANGLNCKIDQNESNEFKKYFPSSGTESIVGNTIYSIEEDDDGHIWVGTNKGISCISIESDNSKIENFEIRNFTTEDGLIDNVIYGILMDKSGDLWLSGNEGLSRFNPSRLLDTEEPQSEIYNYDQSDGLQSNEFNMGAFFKSNIGHLFFGGNNGMSSFDPTKLISNKLIPPINITSITVNNEERPVPTNNKLELTWQDHALTIEYASLNFRKNAKNEYVYQLKGIDNEKIYAGRRRFVNYTNLSPGTYLFHVEGSNNDDIWNREGANLEIRMLPPPWKTWWAYTMYLCLLVFASVSFGRYKIEKEKRKIEVAAQIERAKFEERERVRKKSSQDFHDELGNRITKIALLLGILKSKVSDDDQNIVDRASDNARELSSGLKDFIWMLDPDKETIGDLADRLVLFGNALYEHTEIVFSYRMSSIKNELSMDVDIRKHIIFLFKEAMNNALKYAEAQIVEFYVADQNESILFGLTDNGKGFNEDMITKGYGLDNMKSRAKEIGAEINIISELDQGTTIELILNTQNLRLE